MLVVSTGRHTPCHFLAQLGNITQQSNSQANRRGNEAWQFQEKLMRISTRLAVVAALACMAPGAIADTNVQTPPAPTTSPSFTFDQEKQGSLRVIQQFRACKSSSEISALLTNSSAAQMAVIECTGIGLVAGFQSMSDKPKDPNLIKDLTAFLNGYGLNDKTMPKNSLANLPASAMAHGREMLAGLGPFELRVDKLSTDVKVEPPFSGWPADTNGYKMIYLSPDSLKVTVTGPITAAQMPTTFTTKYEEGAWRIDFGDMTKMAQARPSGGDVSGTDKSHAKTPGAAAAKLFEAVKNDDLPEVKGLLASHPSLIEARDDQGQTPLLADSFWDHQDIAKYLLTHHASVDAKDNIGTTALMQAASFDHVATAQLLLAHGASVNAKDDFGHTALNSAKQMKNDDMVKLLRSHGGK